MYFLVNDTIYVWQWPLAYSTESGRVYTRTVISIKAIKKLLRGFTFYLYLPAQLVSVTVGRSVCKW